MCDNKFYSLWRSFFVRTIANIATGNKVQYEKYSKKSFSTFCGCEVILYEIRVRSATFFGWQFQWNWTILLEKFVQKLPNRPRFMDREFSLDPEFSCFHFSIKSAKFSYILHVRIYSLQYSEYIYSTCYFGPISGMGRSSEKKTRKL